MTWQIFKNTYTSKSTLLHVPYIKYEFKMNLATSLWHTQNGYRLVLLWQ